MISNNYSNDDDYYACKTLSLFSGLQVDGFDAVSPFFHCLVAEVPQNPDPSPSEGGGGRLVGYALYFYIYSWGGPAVYMEDLYVTPTHRGKGTGSKLWKEVVMVRRV